MKRMVLLGLIGFVLVGCGDDKVTKEYLVGDWQCNGVKYKSIIKDDKFSEYMKDRNIYFNWSFKLENNQLYLQDNYTKNWNLNKFIEKHTGEIRFEQLEESKLKIKGTTKKVSSNEFEINDEYIMTLNNAKFSDLNNKVKIISTCIRIK